MTEGKNRNPEFTEHPSEQEFLALVQNSKLDKLYKTRLINNLSDPWVQNQLTRIYNEIDRVSNTVEKNYETVSLLWEALRDDLRRRINQPPKQEGKKMPE